MSRALGTQTKERSNDLDGAVSQDYTCSVKAMPHWHGGHEEQGSVAARDVLEFGVLRRVCVSRTATRDTDPASHAVHMHRLTSPGEYVSYLCWGVDAFIHSFKPRSPKTTRSPKTPLYKACLCPASSLMCREFVGQRPAASTHLVGPFSVPT